MRAPTRDAAGTRVVKPVPRPRRACVPRPLAGWGAHGPLGVGVSTGIGHGSVRMDVTTLLGVTIGGLASHLWRRVLLERGWLELGFRRLRPRLVAGVTVTALVTEIAIGQTGIFVTRAYTWQT